MGEGVPGAKPNPDIPENWDRSGLPGWTYFSDELFALECDKLFGTHWQFVCHVNDLKKPGDFITLDIAGERGLVVRGRDGVLRAFHNLCRHRGSRVVAKERGRCGNVMTCPYHGWTYNLDGTLRGVARRDTFPAMDPAKWGLKPLEMEVWNGLLFVRFKMGPQPGVGELLRRFDSEVDSYSLARMEPVPDSAYADPLNVNWKSVRDVDNEGYHVRQAHPALHDLYGQNYVDEPYIDGISRSQGQFNEGEGRLWSVRHYRRILPDASWLPENHRRSWIYVSLFPNFVLGLYPDSAIFYQEIPVSATCTVQRGAVFRHPEESRELRLARYLSGRIDRDAVEEDRMLTVWSCEAVKSSAYDGIILSDLEYRLRSFHDHLRKLVPVMALDEEPPRGMLAAENAKILAGM